MLGTVGGVAETIGSGAYPQHLPLVVETMGEMQPAIIAHLGYGRCGGGAIAVVARTVDALLPLHVDGRHATIPRRVGPAPETEGTHRVEIVVAAQVEIAAVPPVVAMGGV